MRVRRGDIMAFVALLFAAAALAFSMQSGRPLFAQDAVGQAGVQPAQAQAVAAPANIGPAVSYQGTLRNADGSLANGSYNIMICIYGQLTGGNCTAGNQGAALHQETFTGVQVRSGIFSVVLGDAKPFPANLFQDAPRFIGITVNSDPEMTPRQRLNAVPWALQAASATSAAALTGDAPGQNLALTGNLSASGAATLGTMSAGAGFISDLTVKVARDVGSQSGTLNRTVYDRSLQRYVVEAKDDGIPQANARSVPIDDAKFMQLCGDLDGCAVTIGMRDYDVTALGANFMPTVTGQLSVGIKGNQRFIDFRRWNGDAGPGSFDANGVRETVASAWDCFLQDGEWNKVEQGDPSLGLFLLNGWNSYQSPQMTCVLIIDD